MTEETKQFVIKVLVVVALVGGFYYAFSPYQNCMRGYSNVIDAEGYEDLRRAMDNRIHRDCIEATNW